jgi:hypothetical protein
MKNLEGGTSSDSAGPLTRREQSGVGRSVPAISGLPQREPHKAYPQGSDAGADIDKHSVVRS